MDIGELPRDAKGNVIGGWHVTLCGSGTPDERCMATEIFGQMVERAVARGDTVIPGPRPAMAEIVTPPEAPTESPRPGRKRKPRTE